MLRLGRPVLVLLGAVALLGCKGASAPAEGASDGSEDASGGAEQTPPDAGMGEPPGAEGSPGCDAAGVPAYAPGVTTTASLEASGTRSFRIHVPPGYVAGRPVPVVLMFHGGGGSGEQLQTQSANMDSIADREGFITVYPEGTGVLATWNGGICCGRAMQTGVDDVAFVRALLDHVEGELCVDRRRVFAMGMSNGAILSHRLACDLSDRIAAIAPVAGTIGVTDCRPTRPVAVMQIHGTADGHVPWGGGVGCGLADADFVSVPDTMEGWRSLNGCSAESREFFAEGNGRCTAYDGCNAPVVLCAIEGGGHSWPGGVLKMSVVDCPEDGPQSQSFSASEAAWRFLAENPRP